MSTKKIVARFKKGDMAYHRMSFTPMLIITDVLNAISGSSYEGRLFTMEKSVFNDFELLTTKEMEAKKKEIELKNKTLKK